MSNKLHNQRKLQGGWAVRSIDLVGQSFCTINHLLKQAGQLLDAALVIRKKNRFRILYGVVLVMWLNILLPQSAIGQPCGFKTGLALRYDILKDTATLGPDTGNRGLMLLKHLSLLKRLIVDSGKLSQYRAEVTTERTPSSSSISRGSQSVPPVAEAKPDAEADSGGYRILYQWVQVFLPMVAIVGGVLLGKQIAIWRS